MDIERMFNVEAVDISNIMSVLADARISIICR